MARSQFHIKRSQMFRVGVKIAKHAKAFLGTWQRNETRDILTDFSYFLCIYFCLHL